MVRYISTDDIQEHLELDELNETDEPKLSLVKKWVISSENEVDNLTRNRWDLHKVDNELITPDAQTQDFILKIRPMTKIFTLEYQDGTEWIPSWVEIDSSKYRIVNERISKIRTQDYYWAEEGLRITYEAGYTNLPTWLQDLTKLLVEKRYIMSRLGIAAADSETVSVAVIRIKDKSNASLKYKLDGLQVSIDEQLRLLGKRMKCQNMRIGFPTMYTPPNKRYRS